MFLEIEKTNIDICKFLINTKRLPINNQQFLNTHYLPQKKLYPRHYYVVYTHILNNLLYLVLGFINRLI